MKKNNSKLIDPAFLNDRAMHMLVDLARNDPSAWVSNFATDEDELLHLAVTVCGASAMAAYAGVKSYRKAMAKPSESHHGQDPADAWNGPQVARNTVEVA